MCHCSVQSLVLLQRMDQDKVVLWGISREWSCHPDTRVYDAQELDEPPQLLTHFLPSAQLTLSREHFHPVRAVRHPSGSVVGPGLSPPRAGRQLVSISKKDKDQLSHLGILGIIMAPSGATFQQVAEVCHISEDQVLHPVILKLQAFVRLQQI